MQVMVLWLKLARRFSLAAAACMMVSVSAIAQSPAAPPLTAPAYAPTSLQAEPGLPRTPDGHPDFQAVWTTDFFPMMEASPLSATLVVPEEQAKKLIDMVITGFINTPAAERFLDDEARRLIIHSRGLPLVRGQRRSRLVVLPADGKLPYTPEARKEAATTDALTGKLFDNPEERPPMERCLTLAGLPPVASTLALNFLQIVQTPSYVVIHTEYGGEARIIPFTDTHKPKALHSRLGDSIARWDGDTLVIETIGLPANARVRPPPTTLIVGAEATVIERYTRLSKDELLYQYTVIDPKVYTAPWLAEHSLYRTDKRMYEHACHEGDHSLVNILQAQRVADARLKATGQ